MCELAVDSRRARYRKTLKEQEELHHNVNIIQRCFKQGTGCVKVWIDVSILEADMVGYGLLLIRDVLNQILWATLNHSCKYVAKDAIFVCCEKY